MTAFVMRHRAPGSLRSRLTWAVMMPLTALVIMFAGLTLWVTHDTEADTVDRVLVGSVRTLSLAYDSPPEMQERLLPLTVRLLRRRARPVVHYSVYLGRTLLAGDPALTPPPDYDPAVTGAIDRHSPATFYNSYRDTPLVRGYTDPQDAVGVVQAAYLREGILHGRPVRIAAETRLVPGHSGAIILQVADFVDDRRAYEQRVFYRIAAYVVSVLLVGIGLVWAAVSWGLRPFLQLTRQIEGAQRQPSLAFRLTMPPGATRETIPFVSAFNGLMLRLAQVTRSLQEFTSNASHQMRTPLAIARVHMDVLERYGPESPEGKAALVEVPGAIDTLEKLLGQLIVLARSEERPEGEMQPFDLAAVAQEVLAAAVSRAPADLDIGYASATQGPVMALGEPLLVAELLANLIDNAIRYNRPGGTVTVEIRQSGSSAIVTVTDDGPGIAAEDRERAWARFSRLQGNAGPAGSGLGLPIVRSLAERMEATVSLATGPGGMGLCATARFRAVRMP